DLVSRLFRIGHIGHVTIDDIAEALGAIEVELREAGVEIEPGRAAPAAFEAFGSVAANAPESTIVSAAEQTIGLIVALARNIPQAHAALKQGRWERSRYGGIELAGKTLGVIGFGRIGQQVARRALGLAMNVV